MQIHLLNISHRLRLRCFYIGVVCIVMVDFYKIETVRFNITCQLSSLFAAKERNSPLHTIFFQ
jgi:hypothetical protein